MTNFYSLLAIIVPLGTQLGISKYVAEAINEKNLSVKLEDIFDNLIKLLIAISVIFTIFTIVLSKWLSELLFNDVTYYKYIIVLGIFLIFLTLSNFFEAYLKGLQQISLYVKLMIINAVSGILITIPLVIIFKIDGAIFSIVISSLISTVIFFYALKKRNLIPKIKLTFKINTDIVGKIFKIGLASLLAVGFQQLSLLLIRIITINYFGLASNGIYQSVAGISLNYFSFIFLSLSAYTFPKIASMVDIAEINNEINLNLRFALIIVVPLISIVFVFREYFLVLLYSHEFISAEKLFKYQFMGDFFKTIAWILGVWLIPKMKLFQWVLLEFVFNINYLLIYLILIKYLNFSLEAVSISYCAAYFFHAALNLFVAKKYIQFKFHSNVSVIIFVSITTLISLIYLSFLNLYYGYIAVLPLMTAWIYFTVSKEEYLKTKNIITGKIFRK